MLLLLSRNIGSAMTELAYDIAGGANFKFNTLGMGNLVSFRTWVVWITINTV